MKNIFYQQIKVLRIIGRRIN